MSHNTLIYTSEFILCSHNLSVTEFDQLVEKFDQPNQLATLLVIFILNMSSQRHSLDLFRSSNPKWHSVQLSKARKIIKFKDPVFLRIFLSKARTQCHAEVSLLLRKVLKFVIFSLVFNQKSIHLF